MSNKHDKTLQRMQTRPPPQDISWEELTALLRHLGYVQLKNGRTGGSRRKFHHKEKDALISCHQPHPQPNVDKGCIVDVVEHLTAFGFLGELKK
ncbi:type II toxin-antitoxin system HicA family toxin [Stenotrophomonas maltophilia]|uniref:type II toxin-antitoxin system HicA family toxin n=1 Tax=Stenotrophomonas maltophilia TaxID=40324 RepID=UPI00066D4D28|nr:type II toxin-antitoxin system HicA family toxin [Stenotrophomonas maltophilia]EKT4102128.1 type II toxin-antitoxin system HicA family toxin [Stenotrophomonas maltophilia]MBH1667481.1 type II toxin-antitoxin system HicA family toxin [Stenotrophomonas maltophilia]UXB27319.1 type II toxin-antitoxin system HicA family toxin [Stenotrophomonas maltophilia]